MESELTSQASSGLEGLFLRVVGSSDNTDFLSLSSSSFFDYITEHADRPISESDYQDWLRDIRAYVIEQFRQLAFLQYYVMRLTDDWGDMGRDQIEFSFRRLLCGLGAQDDFSSEHASQFESIVTSAFEAYGFSNQSKAELKDRLDNYRIRILNQSFSPLQGVALSHCLRYLGMPMFVQWGMYGNDQEFILGEGTKASINGYDIFYLDNEVFRSCNTIVGMAAVIGKQQIFVRKEALDTIVFQKWVLFGREMLVGRQSGFDVMSFFDRPEDRISVGIKLHALGQYGMSDSDSFRESDQNNQLMTGDFYDDLKDTVLHHELGHAIVQHQVLPLEIATFAESSKVFGESIITTLLEVLADFAPSITVEVDADGDGDVTSKMEGTLGQMCALNEQSSSRGAGSFLRYFSDVWFFDTAEVFMYSYSELMCSLFIQFISRQSIDSGSTTGIDISFDKIGEAISYRASLDEAGEQSESELTWVEWFVYRLETIVTSLRQIIQSGSFEVDGKSLTYASASDYFEAHERVKDSSSQETDEYVMAIQKWAWVMNTYQANDTQREKVQRFLEEAQETFKRDFFDRLATESVAKQYGYNLREYLFEVCLGKGVGRDV